MNKHHYSIAFLHEFYQAYETQRRAKWLVDLEASGKVIYDFRGDGDNGRIVELERCGTIDTKKPYEGGDAKKAVELMLILIERNSRNGVSSVHGSLLFVECEYAVESSTLLTLVGFLGRFG